MIKTIIPQLLSLETDLNSVKGMYLSQNFSFYGTPSRPLKFHYKIRISNAIDDLKDFEFRQGFYKYSNGVWSYCRNLLGLELKFRYDSEKKIFSFNKNYSKIPFEFGGILPVGKLISDIIALDLFLNDYVLFYGSAFRYQDKNYGLVAPSYNGKTTFLNSIIQKKGQYISEDIVIINFEKNEVFPVGIRQKNFLRSTNKILSKSLAGKDLLVHKLKLDNLIFATNSTSAEKHLKSNHSLLDFLNLCSLTFNSTFAKSYIFQNNLSQKIFNKTDKLRKIKIHYQQISSYRYEDII